MSAEVSKISLVAAVGLVLVGLVGTYFHRRWGSLIAFAGLTAIGAALASLLLFPDILFASNDPEARIWKERNDLAQRELQIAREKELAIRRSLTLPTWLKGVPARAKARIKAATRVRATRRLPYLLAKGRMSTLSCRANSYRSTCRFKGLHGKGNHTEQYLSFA
jgi:hypothetical protein